MSYGKKGKMSLPLPRPSRHMNPNHPMNTERTGAPELTMSLPISKPKPKRKPRPGHNTTLGKYAK